MDEDFDIPEEFTSDAELGNLSPDDFFGWIEEDGREDLKEYVDEAIESGLSLEWAILSADAGISADIDEWEHVTISRDEEGTWEVHVVGEDGEVRTVSFSNEEAAEDLIWADLYFHLSDYGIEFDKEIDSP